ncbi:MAG: TonB-dependent receptor family protein [Burkholderiaceae bacterium]
MTPSSTWPPASTRSGWKPRPLEALWLAALALPAAAQTPPAAAALEGVVIIGSGTEQRIFDTPYAVGVVDAAELRSAGPMVNLSEAMARVPGLVVNLRNNYAQDLQISSRGFGARASFGVRGMRLYSDGIPATGPDGQGQVSHFDLASAQRIEVLRGPFSALYGNNSGGVISMVSAAPTERRYSTDGDLGSNGLQQWRLGIEAPFEGGFNIRANVSGFEVDGFRPQSSAERTLANVRLGWDGAYDRVVVVLNSLDQPALDPLGLSRAQLDEFGPDYTTPQATLFNTRKETRQDQLGASWRHRFTEAGALSESALTAYTGQRAVTQWQSIPAAVQAPPTHPGGVIDFDRSYQGLDGRLVWRWLLEGGRSAQLVAGASVDSSSEDRGGYENFIGSGTDRVLGVTGNLRRDERNRVSTNDVYAQGHIEFAPAWSAALGVRSGRVKFKSDDNYIVPGAAPGDPPLNPDDSGELEFQYTNPVAALQFRASPELNLYASAGRGFDSPTFNELAYKPSVQGAPQTGFNSGLKAQTSQQFEIGAKWRAAALGLALDAALFDARTDDEIGVASSSGGRTTFRNVGRTKRQGAELDLRWRVSDRWRAQMAATYLDATYLDGLLVTAGNRIAGTQQASGYAEVAWEPVPRAEVALEGRAQSDVPVDDANSDFAEGFGLLSLRARWQFDLGPGQIDLLGRIDNLADRRVIGSVIVNDANGRFFEPAAGRTWLISARWSQRF